MGRTHCLLSGCAYGIMLVSIVTHPISSYPLAQEILMTLAGLYLVTSNAKDITERKENEVIAWKNPVECHPAEPEGKRNGLHMFPRKHGLPVRDG